MNSIELEKALLGSIFGTGEGHLQDAKPFKVEDEYHYFYIILEKGTDNFYCGIHSTPKLSDGYFGSGTLIRRKVSVHGTENYTKLCLRFFNTREEAEEFERKIITTEFLLRFRQNCYNLVEGGGGLRKGVTWMQKDGEYYRISKALVPEYLSRGFVKEGTTSDRISLCKGEKTVRVPRSEVSRLQSEGWVLGQTFTTTRGMRVMTNLALGETKMFSGVEIEQKLQEGWVLGQTEAVRKKHANLHKGRIRITNGVETKNVWEKDLEYYLDRGWKRGSHLSNVKGRFYINFKGTQKVVKLQDLQGYLDSGWTLGALRSPRGKGKKVWMHRETENRVVPLDLVDSLKNEGWVLGLIRKNS